MHEAAMIQGAVRAAVERFEQLPDMRAQRVAMVELALGAAGHITEDIARQQFAIAAANTPLARATLTINWLPATYVCLSCMGRFEATTPEDETSCPDCGGVALQVAHQDVCYVQAIEVVPALKGKLVEQRSVGYVSGDAGARVGAQRGVGAHRD